MIHLLSKFVLFVFLITVVIIISRRFIGLSWSLNCLKEVEEGLNPDCLCDCLGLISVLDLLLLFLHRRVRAWRPVNICPDALLNNVWLSHDELLSQLDR